MHKTIKFKNALWQIFLCIFILCSVSCSELPSDCNRFDDWEIISEEEKSDVCIYQQIYLYKNEYYAVCECCICDKVWNAIDCNGDSLCESGEDCSILDFYENAEYLYSAIGN